MYIRTKLLRSVIENGVLPVAYLQKKKNMYIQYVSVHPNNQYTVTFYTIFNHILSRYNPINKSNKPAYYIDFAVNLATIVSTDE